MKKITCALLSLFMITPCFANIHIRSEAVESVIKQKIPGQDAQVAALAEYNAQVKKANNAGIPASGIWQVCKAAGWNTQTADGEAKCRDFENTLMKYATWKFKAVCGDYKSLVQKGTGRCVDDVFSNKVLGGVKVNMLVAPGLAKEYARVKYSDKDLVCSKNYRQTTVPPDDYVQCLSMNKNMAYEFRFDSVTATMDNTINEGTESGVCKIFGLKYSPLGVTLDTAYSKGTSWPAACETTDAKICGKVNESMAKFGRSAKIGTTGSTGNKHSACVITKNAISSPSRLRTAFGIDNYVFKKGGVQLNATQALKTQVCTYVRTTVKSPAITSCDCNDGFTQLYDFSGMMTQVDDVLTCQINGKTVDFVFDDLSERNRKIATGGSQGMDCMAAGGTYAGQQCMYLDEKQCKMLAKANLQNCPTCKKVEYKNGVCQLPSGADAIQAQKDQRIALIVGGAVVGVVVTVATAGTAGAPVSAVVFTLVETGGAVMEYNAQVKIDAIVDEFLLTSQKCKSASCAEKLVKQNLQRLSNVAGDMQAAERNAIDKELARLVGLLPNDSQLFIDILGGESLTEANQKSLFDADSWEPEQVWRAVGITLQMTSIFGAVGKWVLKSTGILAKDLPEATIKITSKAKLAREGIMKTGKTVKTTDGKLIVASKYTDDALELKQTDDAVAMMDMWTGATSGTRNSLQKELTLLEELKDARQAKTGSRMYSGVYEDLSEETKMLLAQNGNDVDAVIRQMSKSLESVNQNTLVLNRELQLLDELENAKQAKTGSRMYSGVYEDLSEETKRLLAQNGNDISKTKQRLNLAAQKLEYKPGNQTLGDFILSPDLESIGGEYSTWNYELSKLKKEVVTKQANGEDATQALAKLRSAASDAVDARLIEQNAIFYKENIARILASDEDLLKQFNNFENLSHGEKEKFIRTFLNRHGADLGVSEDVEISLISKFADDPEAIGRCCGVNNITGKQIIYISEDNLIKAGNGSAKNGLIAAPSHEYGHFIDKVDPNKGVLGSQVSDISKNFYGKPSNKTLEGWLTYTSRPTEKSSFPIGNIVRDDFSDGLRQTITAGKMPTTTISKIDDFKIKYAVPNINPTYVENGGDAYFFIQARPENITGLSNYFRQKGLRVKTTSDGVRVFETP